MYPPAGWKDQRKRVTWDPRPGTSVIISDHRWLFRLLENDWRFGATDSIYIYIHIRPIYDINYFLGLNFREYPQTSYGQKYGTNLTYLHVLDPDIPSDIRSELSKLSTWRSSPSGQQTWVSPTQRGFQKNNSFKQKNQGAEKYPLVNVQKTMA